MKKAEETKHEGHAVNSTVPHKAGCPACYELDRKLYIEREANDVLAGDPDAIKRERRRQLRREVEGD